jgi:hypothetical protein
MRVNLWLCVVVLIVCAYSNARAADATLAEIHDELKPYRDRNVREKFDQLPASLRDKVIPQLADWIESVLPKPNDNIEPAIWAVQVNQMLKSNGLVEAELPESEIDFSTQASSLGFIAEIRVSQQDYGHYLVVRTGIGGTCGYQDLALVFLREEDHWRRLWQSSTSADDKIPHFIDNVLISPRLDGYSHHEDLFHSRLILAIGNDYWCSSNWHSVHYQVSRIGDDLKEPKVILENNEFAYLGTDDPPIKGSIGPNEAVIEFRVESIDGGVHNRPTLRHFKIAGEQVTRIAPIATSPQNFVEEWLHNDWGDVWAWTDRTSIKRLRAAHYKLHQSGGFLGNFIDSPKRCGQNSNRWQIGFTFDADEETKKPFDRYFIIAWDAPYEFKLLEVRDKPSPRCTMTELPESSSLQTFFPVQDWR